MFVVCWLCYSIVVFLNVFMAIARNIVVSVMGSSSSVVGVSQLYISWMNELPVNTILARSTA